MAWNNTPTQQNRCPGNITSPGTAGSIQTEYESSLIKQMSLRLQCTCSSLIFLTSYGHIPPRFLNIIKGLYGVKQGCVLSPLLCLLAMNWDTQKLNTERSEIQWNFFERLEDLDFVDDGWYVCCLIIEQRWSSMPAK